MKLKKFNFKIVNSTNDSAIRIIKIIYFDPEKDKFDEDQSPWLKFSLTLTTILILLYFIFPSQLVEMVSRINII